MSSYGKSIFSVNSSIFPLSIVQLIALLLSLIGIIIGFAAILTPSWQVVYAREIDQWVFSGLWLNCQTRPSGMHACVYSLSTSDQLYSSSISSPTEAFNNLRSPQFYGWQKTLLFILLFAQLIAILSLFSLCLSFHLPTRRFSAIIFVLFLLISVILHSGVAIAFAVLSQMVEYRFFHVSVSGIYEKHRGYSFLLELITIIILIINLLPAIIHLIQVIKQQGQKQQQQQRNRYSPTINLNMSQLDTTNTFNIQNDPSPFGDHRQYYQQQQQKFWSDEDEEERFAMRQLPPLPTKQQKINYYGQNF
ncbi:Protein CBR-CLC-2 [Meloidogyne graminicola]|uniref:Protein CBR-CLC-2 n=1 Tax=Meloidogyne graminicola TaxID=189291 RepID=A0A8S9ZID1_9BILA|nr:Protein CBR-CLC-2 [Meloidogyne graminicola]